MQDQINRSRLVFNRSQPLSAQFGEVMSLYQKKVDQCNLLTQQNRELKLSNSKLARSNLIQENKTLRTQVENIHSECEQQTLVAQEL